MAQTRRHGRQNTPKLNITFAAINTTVLVLSSVTCQMGVWAAERFQPVRTGSLLQVNRWGMNEWMALTYLMGAFFIGGQIFEYAELVHEGLTISSSPYGSVFYLTTGFHGLHVVGGLHRLPLPARPLVQRQAVRPPRGHHRDRHVVLLALRRRRLDRAVRDDLPPEVAGGGRPRPSPRSPLSPTCETRIDP